jgi:hypothetical protein
MPLAIIKGSLVEIVIGIIVIPRSQKSSQNGIIDHQVDIKSFPEIYSTRVRLPPTTPLPYVIQRIPRFAFASHLNEFSIISPSVRVLSPSHSVHFLLRVSTRGLKVSRKFQRNFGENYSLPAGWDDWSRPTTKTTGFEEITYSHLTNMRTVRCHPFINPLLH